MRRLNYNIIMNIYKLKYTDKEAAIADLIAKNVIEVAEEGQNYINGTQAVVECGIIVLTQETYDDEGVQTTAPIFAEGYHYDVMSSNDIIFENEIFVNNPKFTFAGYSKSIIDPLIINESI
jgi:hypothetical protein